MVTARPVAPGGVLADQTEGKRTPLTAFGRYIERRLKELKVEEPGFTKDRVARLSGMSRQHLWRAMRGDTVLTAYELAQLAQVLDLPPKEVYNSFWDSVPPATAGAIVPWSYEEMSEYLNANTLGPDDMLVKEGDARYIVRMKGYLRDRLPASAFERGVMDAVPVMPEPLPRALAITAQEFRLEAMRAGADEQELSFIDSVLASPEAIFRQSGYQEAAPLNEEQQRTELESVIAMLRQWLTDHMGRRRLQDLRAEAHRRFPAGSKGE